MTALSVLLQLTAGTTNLLVVISELRRGAFRPRTLVNLYVALLCFALAAATVAGYSLSLLVLSICAAPILIPAPFVLVRDHRAIRRLEREYQESHERFERLINSMRVR